MRTALLLSGGMDSVALAYWKRPEVAITVDYGQRSAAGEIRAASQIASMLAMEHHVIAIDCGTLGSGDLAGSPELAIAPMPEWWPFRNQMLATFAATKAVSIRVGKLIFGSVKSDAHHLDGTAEFYQRLDDLLSLQEGNIRVSAPALGLTTVELIKTANVSQDALAWTHSCHTDQHACGRCRGCYKHAEIRDLLGWGDSRLEPE